MTTRRQRFKEANAKAQSALMTSAQTGEKLGALGFWSLHQVFQQKCVDTYAAFRAVGVDPETTLPEPTGIELAFSRSVASNRSAVHSIGYTLMDAARGSNGERRVAILKVARNGIVSTTDEGTVVCPNDGSKPYIERHDPTGIGARILQKARDLEGVYTADDIRAAITTTFSRWAAMACRERPSVVYFIPPGATDEIEKVNQAILSIGAGEIFQFVGYRDDAQSVRACVNAVNEGLEAKLTEFAKDADEFTKSTKTRPSTITRAIEETKAFRERANLYQAILGAAIQSVDEKMNAIENTLRATLTNMETAAE